jgi:dTDP-4-amino-4,6-dideoxygalactose transaminase
MLVTNDENLAQRARFLSTQARIQRLIINIRLSAIIIE